MARFNVMAFVSVFFVTSAAAQVAPGDAQNPWQVSEEEKSSPSFDIVDDSAGSGSFRAKGSVIIAGTELIPNTTVGIGMFGERAERPDHTRSTNRDYSVPKTRKAAVGFALRF